MTQIFGIVGFPVKQSYHPAMFNAAFKAEKIDAKYQIFEINPEEPEALANYIYEVDLNHIGGFTITMPYKETVMHYLDYFDPLAKSIGSVNCVLNEDSQLIGYNTDSIGAIEALREKTEIMGKKALVMGAGGAGRAILYAFKEFGMTPTVFDRSEEKCKALMQEFKIDGIKALPAKLNSFDLIINATPVGMLPSHDTLLTANQIPAHAVVMDIVTNPIETPLLREAKKAGAITVSGERMLLMQAAHQFEFWFKKEAPLEVMEKALYDAIRR